MKVDVLLGLQWGDEGKGKVVDVLTPRYDAELVFRVALTPAIRWSSRIRNMSSAQFRQAFFSMVR